MQLPVLHHVREDVLVIARLVAKIHVRLAAKEIVMEDVLVIARLVAKIHV